MKLNPYLAGILAAGALAAMMVVFSRAGMLVLIPVFLGSLPIYVAALGWGTRAGVVATIAIIIFSGLSADPATGLLIGMTIAAPAALAGHQANLAQPAFIENDIEDGVPDGLVWYPLSRILFWITLLIIGAIIFFGLVVDFDPQVLGPQLAEQMRPHLSAIDGNNKISEKVLNEALILNLKLLPFILPSLWIGIHVLNLLLGLRITRAMNVLARPPEDIAAALNLPQFALVFVVVTIAGMLLMPEPLSYGFSVAAGGLVMAFSVVGLSHMHQRIREWPTRTPLLVLIYGAIAFLFFPIYLYAFAGIFKTIRGNGELQLFSQNNDD